MKLETRKRAIGKVYKRRNRIDMPDFQREIVWPQNKKRLLINSILKGWHLPKFYFRRLDNDNFECVDGQQRLAAIFEFFDNELTLDPDTSPRPKILKYSQLPYEMSDEFDDFEIDIEEIEDASDEELEELFKRLQLGTPLNTAEKLNAISGDLRDFCHLMAKKPFFSDKIALRNTRYAHFEILTKLAFIETRGIQSQMRLPQLQSFLEDNKSFSSQSDTAKRLNKSIDFLNSAFPNKYPHIRNKANLLSICMLAVRVTNQNIGDKEAATDFGKFTESFFSQLSIEVEKGINATDRELRKYQQAISSGSNTGISIKNRINILTDHVFPY